MDLSKLSIEELKNAIWVNNNGGVAVGGLPPIDYRIELMRRGEGCRGYHEQKQTISCGECEEHWSQGGKCRKI